MCTNCNNLTSLKGAPEYVNGDFICNRCINLTSLEGAPRIVKNYFFCSNCTKLKSIKGAPEKVGSFYCGNCGVKFTKNDVRNVSNVRSIIVV